MHYGNKTPHQMLASHPYRQQNSPFLPLQKVPNSHGARPVHLIITMIKWIRTSRLPTRTGSRTRRSSMAPQLDRSHPPKSVPAAL